MVADPKLVARARRRRMQPLTPMEALSAALTGEVEKDGDLILCEAVSVLGDLVARIRDPECRVPAPQPAGLKAELRDYQKRGLAWLAEMYEIGLGGCLADDMCRRFLKTDPRETLGFY
ncbi:DEAD/DEAH box helicase [Streptomyces wuyuanensis]|uniref:DEAD/DEAH box helicase n=1 Tax=Streptomyces wuyuanensis TaxID=1196353 RepID=UPI003425C312